MASTNLHYRSSCHCRAIVLDFIADERLEERQFKSCNCSICTKNGYINYYVPQTSITFQRGEDSMSTYSFAPHNRKHRFCPKCGTSVLIISNEKIFDNGKIGINLRTVENLDVLKLKPYAKIDGRGRDPEDEMRAWRDQKVRIAAASI